MHKKSHKVRVAQLSVASNASLVIMKLTVGLLVGSVSVISEAIHSGVDLLASSIALLSVRKAEDPADKDHPFGHGKIENLSGTIEALLIFLAAGWIIIEAFKKVLAPTPLESMEWGIMVMFISATANTLISQMLFKTGRETDSVALLAEGWHLRTDVYTSLGVMFGLGAIWVGARILPDIELRWLDPLAALIVSVLLIKTAYKLFIRAVHDLLDTKLPDHEENMIRQAIAEYSQQIRGFHQLRTRKSGHDRFVDFHIKVDPSLTVKESHAIGGLISNRIKTLFAPISVIVHIEPCLGDCTERCLSGCLLSASRRSEIARRADIQTH
ncbi:MAG: cation diffusion facilitator family transporter [Dissulfurispiraceae bacterium]